MDITESPRKLTQIGFFIGYPFAVKMDGEGIGRFTVRLADGLLALFPHVNIHISAIQQNRAEVERVFKKVINTYPGRVTVHTQNAVRYINNHVPAEIWLVPHIDMMTALELKKPYVLCLHDLVYIHFKDLFLMKEPAFVRHLDQVIQPMANKAAAVVSQSEFIRNYDAIDHLQLPRNKTNVVRLAAPIEEYRSLNIINENIFRDKYGLWGNYIVYPSAIRIHKNHLRLVEAFLNFRKSGGPKLRLVLTSRLRGSHFVKEINHILRETGPTLRGDIVFLNKIPSEDMPSLYHYATGTIVPTLFEGSCSFQILESLVVNTPVAMSNIEVNREVIQNIEAFINFNPYSIAEIERAIHKLWDVRDEGVTSEQKIIIDQILQRTWVDVAREYYNVMQKVVTNRK